MPWITLVANVKVNCPSADISHFNLYIEAAKSVVDYKSHALYLDLFCHENEAEHLKELMVRLDSTRNVADYFIRLFVRYTHRTRSHGIYCG